MTSRKMEQHLEEGQPPAKKSHIGDSEEGQGDDEQTGMNAEQNEVLGTSTMDLAPSRRPLPLEMNCEMYKFLNFRIQKKFIWGMGRGIYKMFGPKLLFKIKKVRNPSGNYWNRTNTRAIIAADGLRVRNSLGVPVNVFAVQPFPISGPQCRADGFPGTILYYYEAKGNSCQFGFLDGAIPHHDNLSIGKFYAVPANIYSNECWVCRQGRKSHIKKFKLPEGVIRPRLKIKGKNVYGCGLVLDPEDQLWIFFTLNGKLLGRKSRITPTVDRLFPAATILEKEYAIVANFGDDPAKPFLYDIKNCPELGLDCI